MAQETRAVYLRGLDPDTYRWLKVRAAQHERSMQAELRAMILGIKEVDEAGGSSAEAMFEKIMGDSEGFDDFVIPPREGRFRPVNFD
jgi:plasmid stability protein